MQIFGVDFSGARADRNTWLTQGVLRNDGSLVLEECRRVKRRELEDLLRNTQGPAVAALDFPFSVPLDFSRSLAPEAKTMRDMWQAVSKMKYDEFQNQCKEFVAHNGEPKRMADLLYRGSFSPLHKVNPNMVPMTFWGMQMLNSLWDDVCSVPPLTSNPKRQLTLLETMPGAALKDFGLPHKGYKKGKQALEKRKKILKELSSRSSVPLPNLSSFEASCLRSDDCLDSLVAAVVAALWHSKPKLFQLEHQGYSKDFEEAVRLEGRIYSPVRLRCTG